MCQAGRVYVISPLLEALGTGSLMSLPGRQHFTRAGMTPCWRIKHILCDRLGACAWCSWTLPSAPFPNADCGLHGFAVINHSREALRELPHLSVVSGTLPLPLLMLPHNCRLLPFRKKVLGGTSPQLPPNLEPCRQRVGSSARAPPGAGSSPSCETALPAGPSFLPSALTFPKGIRLR